MVIKPLAIGVLSMLLAACAVGPDYVRPDTPAPSSYIHANANADAVAQANADPAFWKQFNDPLLTQLVDEALANNRDLVAALARYRQANALLRGARWNQAPTLQADAGYQDRRSSAAGLPMFDRDLRDQDVYQGEIGFSWELDLFGRLRRATEAARADTQARASDMAALQVSIVGELGSRYFQLRGLQEQLRIARANAENQARTANLLEVRQREGFATSFDVDRSRAQLESTRSRIPALESQAAQVAHGIAVLAGKRPDEFWASLTADAAWPQLPERIATDAPAELLRRRPDVAAAERRLASATAQVGVATADLFPRISLSALFGTQALASGDLFKRDSETRTLGVGVGGGFLNVGRVRAQIAATNAGAAESLATYDQSVLRALQDAEDALARWQGSRGELQHLQEAAEASARASDIARLRFDEGAIDTLELLEAENARLVAESALAQGRAGQGQAVVGMYRAMAGGWLDQPPGEKVVEIVPDRIDGVARTVMR
jgi:NodT family efflux transporter outer membrane factor (OMF) lipoprotein